MRKLIPFLLVWAGCMPGGPPPIRYGSDACSYCKMTIMDNRFAASLITNKGRTAKFDAVECLVHYLDEHNGPLPAEIWVTDYSRPGSMTGAMTASFLLSPDIRSPMGGNLAAFSAVDSCGQVQRRVGGRILRWNELRSEIR